MSLQQYELDKKTYREIRKSIKLTQNAQMLPNPRAVSPSESKSNYSEEEADEVPAEMEQFSRLRKQRKRKQKLSDNQKQQSQEKGKKVKKSKQKKHTTKQEENEGIRIAKEKKIEYLFRNICTPTGQITLESLGHSLGKFNINFTVGELQQMLILASKGEQVDEVDPDSLSFQSNEVREDMRDLKIDYQVFRQFYFKKF